MILVGAGSAAAGADDELSRAFSLVLNHGYSTGLTSNVNSCVLVAVQTHSDCTTSPMSWHLDASGPEPKPSMSASRLAATTAYNKSHMSWQQTPSGVGLTTSTTRNQPPAEGMKLHQYCCCVRRTAHLYRQSSCLWIGRLNEQRDNS